MVKDIFKDVSELIKEDKIVWQGTTERLGLNSYWLSVGEHSVRLFDQQLENGQVIHRHSCTCMRASLINCKYMTTCRHIEAAKYFLISNFIEAKWRNKWLNFKEEKASQ